MREKYTVLYLQDGKIYRKLFNDAVIGEALYNKRSEEVKEDEYLVEKAVLLKKSNINAMVLAQTPYCARALKEHREVFAVLEDMAQIIGNRVKIVPYNERKISIALWKSSAVFVESSGQDGGYALVTGRTPEEAVIAAEILEKGAEAYIMANYIGFGQMFDRKEAKKIREDYLNKYSRPEIMDPGKYEEQKLEYFRKEYDMRAISNRKERQMLVDYGNQLVEMGYLQGTWGNLSIRVGDNSMLITPSGIPYDRITIRDIVEVNLGTGIYQGSLKPSSEMEMHREIYNYNKEVKGIVHTHSEFCSIFAGAGENLEVEDSEHRAKLGSTIYASEYAPAGTHELANHVLMALRRNGNGCIMTNHGMIACGKGLKDAVVTCAYMEESARACIEKKGYEKSMKDKMNKAKMKRIFGGLR